MAHFQEVWVSPRLGAEFLVAYLQSSLVVGPDAYSWTEDLEVSSREIVDAYRQVLGGYAIDTNRVVVGGFSSVGMAALEVARNGAVPMAGFVVLCPAKPESLDAESAGRMKARGLRGTLLTTEMDPRLPDQREIAALFEQVGLPHEFIVTPDIGHWIPADLGAQIDRAIAHIFEESRGTE
ncbi:MAG: hypothetical protein GF330_07300 [Candidatus Eisenbacteria bacterium]|nr:hypothetical protein [Candidatus Eisenbacteria bacterium]